MIESRKTNSIVSWFMSISKVGVCLIWWTLIAIAAIVLLYNTGESSRITHEEAILINHKNIGIVLLIYIALPLIVLTLYRIVKNKNKPGYNPSTRNCLVKQVVSLKEFAQNNGEMSLRKYDNGMLKCIFHKHTEVECSESLHNITAEYISSNKSNLVVFQSTDGNFILISKSETMNSSAVPLVDFSKKFGKMSLCRYANIDGSFGIKCRFTNHVEVLVDPDLTHLETEDFILNQDALSVSTTEDEIHFLSKNEGALIKISRMQLPPINVKS